MRRLRDFGVTGALLLVPAVLIVLPLSSGAGRDGPAADAGRLAESVRASLLASPAHLHARVLSLFPDARINETASAYLFPGYLPLLLAVAAVIMLRRVARRSRLGAPCA